MRSICELKGKTLNKLLTSEAKSSTSITDLPTRINLCLDLVRHRSKSIRHIRIRSIFRYCSIRKSFQGTTAISRTSATCIHGRASCVNAFAESFSRLTAARHVGHAGVVWNKSFLLNEFVNPCSGTSMTRSSDTSSAIENVLHRQIDLITTTGTIAGNINAIRQRRQGSMCPTTSAILRNVLVE